MAPLFPVLLVNTLPFLSPLVAFGAVTTTALGAARCFPVEVELPKRLFDIDVPARSPLADTTAEALTKVFKSRCGPNTPRPIELPKELSERMQKDSQKKIAPGSHVFFLGVYCC